MSARLDDLQRDGTGVAALRATFRDGKNALVEHFLHSRATASGMVSAPRG
jgi:hypothetical protein